MCQKIAGQCLGILLLTAVFGIACGDDDGGASATDGGRTSDGSVRTDSGGRPPGSDASGPDGGNGNTFCPNRCGPASEGLACAGCPVQMCGSEVGGNFCCICQPNGIWRCGETCSDIPDGGPPIDGGAPMDAGGDGAMEFDAAMEDAATPIDAMMDDGGMDDAAVDDAALDDAALDEDAAEPDAGV